MLYVISMYTKENGDMAYVLFETTTQSCFQSNDVFLKQLILENNMQVSNISLKNNEITIKTWCNEIYFEGLGQRLADGRVENLQATGAEYTLLCKVDNDKYKLVSCMETVSYVNGGQLYEYIKEHKVTNCDIQNGEYKSVGIPIIDRDTQLEEQIAKKYERHVALTSLLGCRMTFEYLIEGTEVKLKECINSCKNVIIPKFITSIMAYAFNGRQITTLTLDRGVKYIGSHAFDGCNIVELIIPDTVELIMHNAFRGSKRVVDEDGTFKDTVKLLNKNAVIIYKYDNSAYGNSL